MVKLIVKTIVINGKIHKNKRKRFKLGIEGEFSNAMIIYLRRH
jgi:hypothetical protein